MRVEIMIDNAVLEEEIDLAGCFGGIQQHLVQFRARYRVIDLVRVAGIGLEFQFALFVMQHASRHRQHQRSHLGHHAGAFECDDAAIRQRQVDRPPGCDFGLAHVAAFFIQRHVVAAVRQQDCEQ